MCNPASQQTEIQPEIPPPGPAIIMENLTLNNNEEQPPAQTAHNTINYSHENPYSESGPSEEPETSEEAEYFVQRERIQNDYIAFLELPEEEQKCKVCGDLVNSLVNCWQCQAFVHYICGYDQDFGNPYSPFFCHHCLEEEQNVYY